jgi:cell filamentation protein
MYDSVPDPYCYPETTILRNIPDLRTQEALGAFEAAAVTQRADEPLPNGRLSVRHYRALHRHLFQDVYSWSGKYRIVRMAKDGNAFCYPEHISREMNQLFARLNAERFLTGVSAPRFAEQAAQFLATLNAIHPFREGNGRTQLLFLTLVSARAGPVLDLEALEPRQFMAAMIESFHGSLVTLTKQIRAMAS